MRKVNVVAALFVAFILVMGISSCKNNTEKLVLYTVTVSDNISNGKITADKMSAEEKETVTLTLSADEGYEFESLSVKQGKKDVSVAEVTKGEKYTFVMPKENVTVMASFKKIIIAVTEISLNMTKLTLKAGCKETLTAIVKPDNATDKTLVWTSDKTDIATVSENGEISALAVGSANITATAGKLSAICTLTVTPYIGIKAPEEANEVGDIVFSDGSATPYTEDMSLTDAQKSAAIALIFYKGTELNSDDFQGNADTTTSRTLGVGLKHNKYGLVWCLSSAAAYDKSLPPIQCLANERAGDLSYTGMFTFTGDKNGSDNLEQISAFLTAADGVEDDTATAANYPAFYFAKNYKDVEGSNVSGTDYETGWYLPSLAELSKLYVNGRGTKRLFTIDNASEVLGGDKFGSSYYLSSSGDVSTWGKSAFLIDFYSGSWDYTDKDHRLVAICCIRDFN